MTQEPFLSYAETMEDVMLWRALREEAPGFYIDAGAGDPDRASVSRAFYERGWRGLDIEPVPELAGRLRERRPRDIVAEVALADHSGMAELYRAGQRWTLDRDRAGGAETRTVDVTTLAELCREHVPGEVHFLRVDVAGLEEAVLRGTDFVAIRPWIVLAQRLGDDLDWMLRAAGYVFVWFDGLNRFYVAEERHTDLARHFRVPPNPGDHYRVADPARDELAALAQERLARIEALEAELTRLQAPAPPPSRPRALGLAYRLVRPVVRPLGWRLRTFMTGHLRDEHALILAKLDEVLAQPGPAVERAMADAAERLLLTLALALDRDRP